MTNFVGLGISLITQAIVPRTLGPSAYGNYSFLTNFFMQLSSFMNLNSSTAFYTKLSQRQHDKGLISFYFYITLIIGFLMSIFVVVCYQINIDQIIWPEQATIFIIMASIWAFLQLYSGALIQVSDAYGLTVKTEVLNMIQKICGLLIILVLFSVNGLNLFNYFIFQIFMISMLIISLFTLIQKIKSPLLSHWRLKKVQYKSYAKEFTSFCLPLVLFSIFSIMGQMLDLWLMQKFSGSTQQGFYALAYQTGTVCFLFVSAMTPLVMREYAISFVKNDIESMRRIFVKYNKMLFAIAAFFGCFLAAQAKNVMLIFGGQAYSDAVLPIMIMCFYPIHQTYGQMNGSFFLRQQEQKYTAI